MRIKTFELICENDYSRKLEFRRYEGYGIIDLLEFDIRQVNPDSIYECTGISHNEFPALIHKLVTKAMNNKSKLIQFYRWYPYYDSKSMTGYGDFYISPSIEYNDGDKDMKLILKVCYDGINKSYTYKIVGRKRIEKFVNFLIS